MKDLFVPYKIAVLAKEHGFNQPCFAKHFVPEKPENRFRYNTEGHPKQYNDGSYGRFVSAPLYQQLIEWLESKYRIIIARVPYTSGNHKYEIWKWNTKETKWEQIHMRIEGLNEAIIEGFKLINDGETKKGA